MSKPDRDNRDLAIIILDRLVEGGVIPDCTDTDDNTEWDTQDIIEEVLNIYLPNNKKED